MATTNYRFTLVKGTEFGNRESSNWTKNDAGSVALTGLSPQQDQVWAARREVRLLSPNPILPTQDQQTQRHLLRMRS